jgi:Sulfotransferase family
VDGSAVTPGPTRVLSIVGPGRSGTTVLGNILGEVAGIANAGEMRWLWRRGLGEKRPCGCGRAPIECPLWSAVLERVLLKLAPSAGTDGLPGLVDAVLSAQGEVLTRRNRIRVLSSAKRADTGWEALRSMRTVTAELCASLAEISGADLVIDTSKLPQVAALLAGADRVEHFVLHVVRDPRAVAFSWQRPKALPVSNGTTRMATMRPVSSAGAWVENCLGAEILRRHVPPDRWLRLRYEDFVKSPRASVRHVLDFVGITAPDSFVDGNTVLLQTNHTLAGNPNRFRTGLVQIIEDDEWRAKLARRDRMLVGAVASPLLRRYGYDVRAGAREPHQAELSPPRPDRTAGPPGHGTGQHQPDVEHGVD